MVNAYRYIQYARRSSDENSNKQMQSIHGQEGDLERVARELGLNVTEKLEESRTAKEPGRPVFNGMIKLLKKGKVDAILCWHIDRLTRNELDSGTIRWLLRQGVIKEIRTPHKVYRPEDSAFITAIESAQSEQFIIDHMVRVNRGMKQKCGSGGIPFRVPQGYLNDRLNRTAHIDPDRFPIICRLFKAASEGTYSVAELHRMLHDDWGYRKKMSRNSPDHVLSVNALHKLLANPFYTGSFKWQGQTYSHNLPRAVSHAQWQRIQEIIGTRRHRCRAAKRPRRTFEGANNAAHAFGAAIPHDNKTANSSRPMPYVYAGLVTCASCGSRATASAHKGHIYYYCNNRLKICTKKGVREEEIDRQIWQLLESISIPEEFEEIARSVWETMQIDEAAMLEGTAQARAKAREDIKRQKEALLGLYLQGHLEEAEYANKKQDLNTQEITLTVPDIGDGQSKIEAETAKREESDRALRMAIEGRREFLKGDVSAKRFIACHLAEQYLLNNGDLQVKLDPLYAQVRTFLQKTPEFAGSVRTV